MKIITPIMLLFIGGCNSQAQNDKAKIDSIFELALKADSHDDYKTSILYYNQILDMDSLHIGALVNRGQALIFNTDTMDGFADLNRAVKHYPHERTYYARGTAYMYMNNLDSAERDLKEAKKLNPRFAEAYLASSNIHFLKKEYMLALIDCRVAEEFGVDKILSAGLKAEMSKTFGEEVVSVFNYEAILQTVMNLPSVKKAEEELGENKKYLNYGVDIEKATIWFYKITVREGKTNKIRFVFKMDASSLKILNSDEKK